MMKSYYDIIVIGSGIGGLTGASLLAKAGKSVLVLEAHDRAGGYAHGFKRKHYHFDAGVHLVSGCHVSTDKGQVIGQVLQAIGVENQLEFIPVNPFSCGIYPHLKVKFPQTVKAFIDTLANLFPKERQGLTDLIALHLKLAKEVSDAEEIATGANIEFIKAQLPTLYHYRRATLAEVLAEYLNDVKLRQLFATNWPYLGLPASELSFIYWAMMLNGYLVEGAYYCKGGFQNFANALVAGLKNHGGEISYKTTVTKINVIDKKVRGVLLESGQQIDTETVISNADMRHTVKQLVGEDYFPKGFIRRLKRQKTSLSIFAVYIATNLEISKLDLAHENFCYDNFDHDANFLDSKNHDLSWLGISIPTLCDDSLAPKGEHIVMLTSLVPYEVSTNWKALKADYLARLLAKAEQYLPDLRTHLRYVDSGTPQTMERYTANHQGAAYGWALTPQQTGFYRVNNQSPLQGLYFAGHWTSPGGGVSGVSVSGVQVAQKILGIKTQQAFWQRLNKAD